MASDREPDWVDRVLARGAMWEPPEGFAERIAARAVVLLEPAQALSHRFPLFNRLAFVRHMAVRACELVVANAEGAAWVIGQYWNLLRSTRALVASHP